MTFYVSCLILILEYETSSVITIAYGIIDFFKYFLHYNVSFISVTPHLDIFAEQTMDAATWHDYGTERNRYVAMPIDWQVPLLLLLRENGSIRFYVPIFRLPLSVHSLILFYVSSFIFASLFVRFIPSPLKRYFAFCLCIFVDFVFGRLVLLFHAYIEGLQSKMCLRAPYLKITTSAHWCWSVFVYSPLYAYPYKYIQIRVCCIDRLINVLMLGGW